MGVPTSEVGYTIATSRRETTKVHKNMWWHWGVGEEKKYIHIFFDLFSFVLSKETAWFSIPNVCIRFLHCLQTPVTLLTSRLLFPPPPHLELHNGYIPQFHCFRASLYFYFVDYVLLGIVALIFIAAIAFCLRVCLFLCLFICEYYNFLLCYDRLSVRIRRRQNSGFLQTYFSLEYSEIWITFCVLHSSWSPFIASHMLYM